MTERATIIGLPRSLLNHDRKGVIRGALLAAALFALNAAICWPLFHADYLDNFQSNEGVFMSLARLLGQHFPHSAWFPWFDAGLPLENAYLPFVPALVALISSVTGASLAHVLHFLEALAYCCLLYTSAFQASGALLAASTRN